eukprot:scaffold25052_cov110-Isochrysis_galbana.AAC.3
MCSRAWWHGCLCLCLCLLGWVGRPSCGGAVGRRFTCLRRARGALWLARAGRLAAGWQRARSPGHERATAGAARADGLNRHARATGDRA